jgi:hypothetical protein
VGRNSAGGFPEGKVAQAIIAILYPRLTPPAIDAIVACLMSHLLVEEKINRVLYQWLKQDAPSLTNATISSKADANLWKNIAEMAFARKYSLMKPFFSAQFPKEAEDVMKLNTLRNQIMHGKAIEGARFNDRPISKEATVEEIFLAAQAVAMQLDRFAELLDLPHASAEKWRRLAVKSKS